MHKRWTVLYHDDGEPDDPCETRFRVVRLTGAWGFLHVVHMKSRWFPELSEKSKVFGEMSLLHSSLS